MIGWELASTPEYRQMMAKYKQIEAYMEPPFVIEFKTRETAANGNKEEDLSDTEKAELEKAEKKAPKAAARRKGPELEPVEKQTVRELFDYVLN